MTITTTDIGAARAVDAVKTYGEGDAAVQAVLIATPSYTHAELAIAAAGAGKQIFCEKPMALTVAATTTHTTSHTCSTG